MSKKCTPLWPKAHFEVKCAKHITFGAALAVEMLKKCTVQNRFWSQKVQSTLRSEQLWQLRSLWCEAHFEVKMLKAPDVRTTSGLWDVEKVHAVVARSYTALRYTLRYTTSLHFTTLHYTTLLCTTLHYPTLHLQLQLRVQLHLQLRVQLQLQPRITRFQLHYTTPDDTALQLELQLQLHL